jgi:ankyrin repeat protein
MAAIYKRKEAFFAGIKKKASINLADNYGNTPLHYSCRAAQV